MKLSVLAAWGGGHAEVWGRKLAAVYQKHHWCAWSGDACQHWCSSGASPWGHPPWAGWEYLQDSEHDRLLQLCLSCHFLQEIMNKQLAEHELAPGFHTRRSEETKCSTYGHQDSCQTGACPWSSWAVRQTRQGHWQCRWACLSHRRSSGHLERSASVRHSVQHHCTLMPIMPEAKTPPLSSWSYQKTKPPISILQELPWAMFAVSCINLPHPSHCMSMCFLCPVPPVYHRSD